MSGVRYGRIAVVGTAGAGKTWVAAEAARRLGIRHVELDAIHWGPGWSKPTVEGFRAAVAEATAGQAWVADGNYGAVRDIVWGRAQLLVWLDYPLWLALWQLSCRTIRRVVTREKLWGRNRETFRGALLARDSLLLHAARTHGPRRAKYGELLANPPYDRLHAVRLRSRKETAKWLASLGEDTARRLPCIS